MTTTFPTTIIPDINSNKSHSPRVKKIAFGNGYQQIYGDGINNNLEKWSVVFSLNDTDKQTVEDFFLVAAGFNYFNWTSPETGASLKRYLCPSWTINFLGPNWYRINAKFIEWAGLV